MPRARKDNDEYMTPDWVVDQIVPMIPPTARTFLEPACGDGSMIRRVGQALGRRIFWTAVDVQPKFEGVVSALPDTKWHCGDFLKDYAVLDAGLNPFDVVVQSGKVFDVAITNPPYAKAQEFVEACLARAKVVIMLLRLNFLGAQRRYEFFAENRPDVYVLSRRPSFIGGATDSTEYAWFVWGHPESQRCSVGHLAGWGQVCVLPPPEGVEAPRRGRKPRKEASP